MQPEPQLNRSQRRAREKRAADRRYAGMSRKQRDAYENRARLWAKGAVATGRHIDGKFEREWTFPAHVPADKRASVADYATYAPMRWRVTACLVLRYDDGTETRENEAECSQRQKVAELYELREQLMRELKATANTRFVWDEYFEMECLG
jgi:hypothetical protein